MANRAPLQMPGVTLREHHASLSLGFPTWSHLLAQPLMTYKGLCLHFFVESNLGKTEILQWRR